MVDQKSGSKTNNHVLDIGAIVSSLHTIITKNVDEDPFTFK